ncbi:MAG: M23 family metallopeptidase [Ferruginibacter sp.]
MNLKKHFLLLAVPLAIIFTPAFSQDAQTNKYPQQYFGWPLQTAPGIAANFGELRPNHYHMGLDCRTDKKQNIPVLAAADGYIARVKIEPYGFGRCIYIFHPNGFTTLYAHLNDFEPALEKYITEQQYKLKSWRVLIDIPANLFPVKKGQLIAYSGNTGGSQGPHLHFEIRDTKSDKVLNPLLFGFPLPDNIPPDISRLALYDRCISTYEQTPKFVPLKKTKEGYSTVPDLLTINTDKVSFAIGATDRYNGSSNANGIFEARLFDNERPVIYFRIDSISYDETRFLNAHIDYKLRHSGGPFVQHLSQLPGYTNGIYKKQTGDGVIHIDDDSIHNIRIEVRDAAGNISLLKFGIKRGLPLTQKPAADPAARYQQNEFHPGFVNVFENNEIRCLLPEDALYDSIRFQYSAVATAAGYPIYRLHHGNVPVQVYFPVSIRANIPKELSDKVVMFRFWNNAKDYAKATNENGWYKASFREFGNFQLLVDTLPPQIVPLGFKEGMNCSKLKKLVFVITDNTEEIKNFSATLDGNWLRFSNDKGRNFVYDFDDRCAPGTHELKLVATDQAGNSTERVYHFTR